MRFHNIEGVGDTTVVIFFLLHQVHLHHLFEAIIVKTIGSDVCQGFDLVAQGCTGQRLVALKGIPEQLLNVHIPIAIQVVNHVVVIQRRTLFPTAIGRGSG